MAPVETDETVVQGLEMPPHTQCQITITPSQVRQGHTASSSSSAVLQTGVSEPGCTELGRPGCTAFRPGPISGKTRNKARLYYVYHVNPMKMTEYAYK